MAGRSLFSSRLATGATAALVLSLVAACGEGESVTPVQNAATSPAAASDGAAAPRVKALAPSYTATVIETPAPVRTDEVLRVNKSGVVAGTYATDGVPFVWSAEHGRVDPLPAGRIRGLNDAGLAIVQVDSTGDGNVPYHRGYRWSREGGAVELLSADGGTLKVSLNAIDNEGSAFGDSNNRPQWWNAAGLARQPYSRIDSGSFVAVNNNRQVVWIDGSGRTTVSAYDPDSNLIPTVGAISFSSIQLTDSRIVLGLFASNPSEGRNTQFVIKTIGEAGEPTILPGRTADSSAFLETKSPTNLVSISEAGAVIVGIPMEGDGIQSDRPFYWTKAGGVQDILGSAGTEGRAQAISPAGLVVGWYRNAEQGQRPFAWSEGEGFVDLVGRIAGGSGLAIDRAVAVNDSGHILAFAGEKLVLLSPGGTPPQPETAAPQIRNFEAFPWTVAGLPTFALAHFGDADGQDKYVANWDWGDGTVETRDAWYGQVGGLAAGEHRYSAPGTYRITITLSDSAGNQATANREIRVVNWSR